MNKFLKIGLTGGIGSGKSMVLKIMAKKGIPVLQTDLVGHQLLERGKIKKILVKKFGKIIVDRQGRISRKILGREVFHNPKNQQWLNELLHPAIRKKVAGWLKTQQNAFVPMAVVEVPLLFERGYYRRFDGVLSVSAPSGLRRKRLLKRGWNSMEIRRREKFQWSQKKKDQKADWVIYNQNSVKDLKYAVDHWLEKLTE